MTEDRSSTQERHAHPSVRTLAAVWALAVGGFAIVLLVTSVWTGRIVRATTLEAARHSELVTALDDVWMAAFTYRRHADLELVTAEPRRAIERERARAFAFTRLNDAMALGDAPDTIATLSRLRDDLEMFVDERDGLGREGADLHEVVRQVRPLFDRLAARLETLRDLQTSALNRANADALAASRVSDAVSAAVLGLLLVGVIGGLVYVRRFVVRPVVSLHGAIERYRSGDRAARADADGPHEIAELARAFNAMSAELDSQHKQLLTYLAGVAHDLRNPLSALKMGVHVVSEGPPRARARTLGLLDRQVDRLARIIQDLLDATRIEAGQLRLERRRYDLLQPVREILDLYGPTSPDHELVVDAPSQPVWIEGDAARIEQVVSNLVSNAIKYSPGGGRVLVRVDASDREAVFEVTDQGVGIPPEERARIFSPFHRSAPDVAAGAGLGLSVVRRIVEAHGGTVDVESERGVGSTFRVRLPRASPAECSPKPRRSA